MMTLTFTPETLVLFLLLVVRLGAMVTSLPLLGARQVPGQIKILLTLTLSVGFYPLMQAQHIIVPQRLEHVVLAIVGEMLIGLLIGFVAQVLFAGMQLGGELVSQQMGLNIATIFDPHHVQHVSLLAHFHYVLAVLVFLSSAAHHWFIMAMAESVRRIPLASFSASGAVIEVVLGLLGQACVMAIQLAAPVSTALLLATLALGIVARLVPQLNVFILSFPITFGIGTLLLGMALPYLVDGLHLALRHLGNDLGWMLRALGCCARP